MMDFTGKTRIILASASPRRRELLMQVGIVPEVVPSCVDEVITKIIPEEVVMELSSQKAEDVAKNYFAREIEEASNLVIIGSDTVVSAEGEILGKPHDEAEAARMIARIQGRTHQVCTGVTMIFGKTGERVTFAETTDVSVYPMDDEEIRRYIAAGESLDKAGAYGIQGRFAAYISRISGDYNTVVGLPTGRVCQELRRRLR